MTVFVVGSFFIAAHCICFTIGQFRK